MIVNGTNLSELYVQYSALFSKGFEMTETQWAAVAMLVPSSSRSNLFSFLGSASKMREWLGPRQAKKLAQFDYRLVNKKFEATIEISRDDVEDNLAADAGMAFLKMGESAKRHPDELVFPLLTGGTTAICYDDTPFFGTAHPNGVNGASTVANIDTSGSGPNWYLMSLGSVMKPLIFQKRREYNFKSFTDLKDPRVWREDMYEFGVDARVVGGYGMWQQAFRSNDTLDATHIEEYTTAMRRYTTDEGQPLKQNRPTHLVVPPELEMTAKRFVAQNLVLDPSGTVAIDNIHKNSLQIIVSEELPA